MIVQNTKLDSKNNAFSSRDDATAPHHSPDSDNGCHKYQFAQSSTSHGFSRAWASIVVSPRPLLNRELPADTSLRECSLWHVHRRPTHSAVCRVANGRTREIITRSILPPTAWYHHMADVIVETVLVPPRSPWRAEPRHSSSRP